MLKSALIINALEMPANCHEDVKAQVKDLVTFKTMTAEKQRILATKLGTKKLSDLISEGEKLYPGKDWAEYSDIEMSTAFAGWTEKATDLREDFITANSNLEACQCDETTFKDLPDTDKIFVTLICHSVMPKMGLDSDLVPESLGKTIATWYQSGKGMSGLNKALRDSFRTFIGQSGDWFDGLKLKASDMAGSDIRHFIAYFERGASRKVSQKKDGTVEIGEFDYKEDFSQRVVANKVTDLLTVYLLSRADKVEVVA